MRNCFWHSYYRIKQKEEILLKSQENQPIDKPIELQQSVTKGKISECNVEYGPSQNLQTEIKRNQEYLQQENESLENPLRKLKNYWKQIFQIN